MKKYISAAILLGALSGPALAINAQEAKQLGLIAEDCQGYVKVVKPEGKAVAAEINAKRKAEYEKLAAEQGIPVDVVAATTGKKLCN